MSEFEKYFKGQSLYNGDRLDRYKKQTESLYTPMIVEERELNVTILSVFDRLMLDRIIWLAGPVTGDSCTVMQGQLLFLDSTGNEDITMHLNTPGGEVTSGLSVVDVMDLVKSDIVTVNTAQCCSMGSILLGAGTKGKRRSLRFSKTMIHQSSGGLGGNIQDARIWMKEWEKDNKLLISLLSEYTGQTQKTIAADAERDNWLSAKETLKYGLIDEVVTKTK